MCPRPACTSQVTVEGGVPCAPLQPHSGCTPTPPFSSVHIPASPLTSLLVCGFSACASLFPGMWGLAPHLSLLVSTLTTCGQRTYVVWPEATELGFTVCVCCWGKIVLWTSAWPADCRVCLTSCVLADCVFISW